MNLSRRQFLGSATALAYLQLSGCDTNPTWFGQFKQAALEGPIQVPLTGVQSPEFHVLSRLGYGPRPQDYKRIAHLGVAGYVAEQLKPEQIDDGECERRVRRLEALAAPLGELYEYKEGYLLKELTRGAVLRATYSERQLYEQMVGFWSDHFNIDSSKGDCRWLKVADDREVIRKHAMGSFPALLRASALSPAMLWYLDGRANRKATEEERPNENYARELLELHTLGVEGGYSQQDVGEVARCLTGWTTLNKGIGKHGKVVFRKGQHDDGEKLVLGHRISAGGGEKDLEQVLDIVALHPSTAQFIARKLCVRFIEDDPSQTVVDAVAKTFTDSKGDIASVLDTLFQREEFWAARGEKFKRPFRYMVSALRATHSETDAPDALLDYLMRMGHAPFQYPTPDGYGEGEAAWSGTLLWRWHLARALAENRVGGVTVDWNGLKSAFEEEQQVLAHFWGREAVAKEVRILKSSPMKAAVALAAPAFQVY